DHAFVQRAAGLARRDRLGFLRKETFEVVLLAPELLRGRFVCGDGLRRRRRFLDRRVLDARPGRRFDALDWLEFEGLVLVHPNILLVRSIPRSRAATSSSSL